MVENRDIVEVHRVQRYKRCSRALKSTKVLGYDCRQVFDLPPIQVEVSEHRAEIKECERCGEITTCAFPEGVTHKAQYGPRAKASVAYINGYRLLSYERAAELFEDLFGIPLSAGAEGLSYYRPHAKWGKQATDAISMLPAFEGKAV